MRSSYNKLLRNFSMVLAVSTLLLIIAGGLVTSTDSGLSVPDWPLSYGMVMPPMVGGILYEHGHRMIATLVGLLTVILLVLVIRKEERTWMKKLAGIALFAVILQGVLGGLTVLYLLPTWISVSHASLAQTFFCVVAGIALFESSWWQNGELSVVQNEKVKSLFSFGIFVVAAVYVQLILGALMRHSGAGLAVPDFPLAFGQLFPSLTPTALAHYNAELIAKDIRLAADGPITRDQVAIHMLHRFWAIVVGTLVLVFAYRVYKQRHTIPALRFPAAAMFVLIPAQITLGAYTVLSRKAVDITTAHVATGALILVTTVLTTLMIYRILPHPSREQKTAYDLGGARA
jgi:cytochrome c oxidase assembly protein subunit 15